MGKFYHFHTIKNKVAKINDQLICDEFYFNKVLKYLNWTPWEICSASVPVHWNISDLSLLVMVHFSSISTLYAFAHDVTGTIKHRLFSYDLDKAMGDKTIFVVQRVSYLPLVFLSVIFTFIGLMTKISTCVSLKLLCCNSHVNHQHVHDGVETK